MSCCCVLAPGLLMGCQIAHFPGLAALEWASSLAIRWQALPLAVMRRQLLYCGSALFPALPLPIAVRPLLSPSSYPLAPSDPSNSAPLDLPASLALFAPSTPHVSESSVPSIPRLSAPSLFLLVDLHHLIASIL